MRGTRARVRLCSLCASLAVVLTLSACGDDDNAGGGGNGEASEIPSGAIAVVGDAPVTDQQVNARVAVLLRGHNYGSSTSTDADGNTTRVPEPACVRDLERQLSEEGVRGLSEDRLDLDDECQASYDYFKQSARDLVLRALWLEQEAEDRDVTVSEAEARKRADEIEDSYASRKAFRKAYRDATEADIAASQRELLLTQKLMTKYEDEGKKPEQIFTEREARRRELTRCRPTATLTASCDPRAGLPVTAPTTATTPSD